MDPMMMSGRPWLPVAMMAALLAVSGCGNAKQRCLLAERTEQGTLICVFPQDVKAPLSPLPGRKPIDQLTRIPAPSLAP